RRRHLRVVGHAARCARTVWQSISLSAREANRRCTGARKTAYGRGMLKSRSPNLITAEPEDAERLASLSRAAKLSYHDWAQLGWVPPSDAAERARWQRRLIDPAGWTLIASDSDVTLGAIHFTGARTERGEGTAIE